MQNMKIKTNSRHSAKSTTETSSIVTRPSPTSQRGTKDDEHQTKLIPLTQGQFAIVDADDYERLSQHKWCAFKVGNGCYARRHSAGKTTYMHHEVINVPAGMVCDHINHNTLDNRRCNLRACTYSQNAHNRLPCEHGTSKYKGVCWDKNNLKWKASICYQYDVIHIGYYDYEEDAAIAYDDMAIELFGEFACLNFHHRPEIRQWIEQMYLFSPMEVDINGFLTRQ